MAERTTGDLGGPGGGERGNPFEQTYRAHRSTVLAFLHGKLRSEEDAEDLAHETFVRAQRSGEMGRLRHPAAFLLKIARNLLFNRVRREKIVAFSALEELGAAEIADPRGTPEQVVAARLELRALAEALIALPRRTREAVILHKFQNLTCRQVAAVMGTSPKTVEKQLARGIAECRRAVRGEPASRGRVLPFAANGEGGAP